MSAGVDSLPGTVAARPARRIRKPSPQAARPAPVKLPRAVLRGLARQRTALGLEREGTAFDLERFRAAVAALRTGLRREGLTDETIGAALTLVSAAMAQTLGRTPYPTQLQAAWLMLRGRLVEMATGEGKTLAAALARAVGALSGVPVHVLTANDYLVERDRSLLEPFYRLLGLSSAIVLPAHRREQRAAAYRCDLVHLTARELVFDYLNDHLRLGGERDPRVLRARTLARAAASESNESNEADEADEARAAGVAEPVVPALAFAVIDEADSILLDEACVPLILSKPAPDLDGKGLRVAFTLARDLDEGAGFRLDRERRLAMLTDRGRLRVTAVVAGAGGLLRPARRACELVESALVALHLFRRDREYAVVGGELVLIDEVTGRVAEGRRWSGALHSMVEIKEGLEPRLPAVTAAQMTYQSFFDRYQHLCGMSGTLMEARRELARTYGLRIARVPLARPDRRRWLGERLLVDAEAKWRVVAERVGRLHRRGRPVLIGTESVAASLQLSARLREAGIEHAVLNAVQTRDEAELVARAGRAGAVTVATNIAGRGTDIRLDPAARAAGGLHVIATMRNRSRRIDRQLIGRGARHGDPGSAESVLALDDSLLSAGWSKLPRCWFGRAARHGVVPAWLARLLVCAAQRKAERHDRLRRQRLRLIEERQAELFGWFGGME